MSREIKFRVWIPEAKHLRSEAKSGMFYQENQYLYSFIRRIHDQFVVTHPSYLPFELEERLMEYTGIKDKNGKEIYEGDIVSFKEFHNIDCKDRGNAVVRFGDTVDECGYTVGYHLNLSDCKQKRPKPTGFHRGMSGHILEVIGNIYQDKHLLNDTD